MPGTRARLEYQYGIWPAVSGTNDNYRMGHRKQTFVERPNDAKENMVKNIMLHYEGTKFQWITWFQETPA